ncbi:hypothetical protein [Kibdelosporangium phytohabitans]|nr:hypothetical protein [Kibdelosporangium phytohabitans]MBE1462594.1 hypothetical protein [Kibdelosporangium phytohabitans]
MARHPPLHGGRQAPLWLKALCDKWIVLVFGMLALLVVGGGRAFGLAA